MLREMSSQIFLATIVYNFIKLANAPIPSLVGKSLSAKFLKYFVSASSTPSSADCQKNASNILGIYTSGQWRIADVLSQTKTGAKKVASEIHN